MNLRKKIHPIYINSVSLLGSNGLLYGAGFIFWMIITRKTDPYAIGIASTITSIIALLSSISTLGLDTGLIRFLPKDSNRNVKISTTLLFVILVSILTTLVAVVLLPFYAQNLSFIGANIKITLFIIAFTAIQSSNTIIESICIALRKSSLVLYKNIIAAVLKILLPSILIFSNPTSILFSICVSLAASGIAGMVLLHRYGHINFIVKPVFTTLRPMIVFSAFSFSSGFIGNLPSYILPIMITNLLGASQTAYYSIAGTIGNLLFIIPLVVTQNLLVEGSHEEEDLPYTIVKSVKIISFILLPSVSLTFLGGHQILSMFSHQYADEGFIFLQYLAASSILVAINYILGTILTIYKRMTTLLIINTAGTISLLTLSYGFFEYGLTGIGIATILTQIFMTILYMSVLYSGLRGFLLFKKRT